MIVLCLISKFMTKHYLDYFWKNGLPAGISPVPENHSTISYKIPSDPYHRYISIEKYIEGFFSEIIYDSVLFNFRHLNAANQMSWQKTLIKEQEDLAICHIRNQDDRLILIEEYQFENGLCRQCKAYSPHKILLSIQKIFYKELNDLFDGLILYDSNQHAVMSKKYERDPESREFSTLLEEQWNMKTSEM
jgi:hypothetical protein